VRNNNGQIDPAGNQIDVS